MKLRIVALASVAALVSMSPATAQLTTFVQTQSVSGTGKNIEVGTRDPSINNGNAYVRGFSSRTGVAKTTDFNKNYATNGISLSQVGLVDFDFKNIPIGIATGGDIAAGNPGMIRSNAFYLNVFSNQSPATVSGTNNQPAVITGFTGTIVFKPVGSGTFNNGRTFDSSSILLAITFSDTRVRRPGGVAGSTDTFVDDNGDPNPDYDATNVTYYSDYLDFGSSAQQSQSTRDFGINFSAVTNVPGTNNTKFRADSVGTFASDPVPIVTTPGVPETSTWAMMLIGFGAIGGTMRTRRQRGVVNA